MVPSGQILTDYINLKSLICKLVDIEYGIVCDTNLYNFDHDIASMLNENIEMYYSHCINPSRGYIAERTFYIDSEVFNGEKNIN